LINQTSLFVNRSIKFQLIQTVISTRYLEYVSYRVSKPLQYKRQNTVQVSIIIKF